MKPLRENTMIAIAARLAVFASNLGLTVDVTTDGRGGYVTTGTGDCAGILLGKSERAARATLCRLVA